MTSDVLPDGRKVIARTPALLPVPNQPDRPCTTIDEVLLEDETVVFQCVHPNPIPGTTGKCDRLADNPISIRSHQKLHGKVAQARHATREAQKAETARQLLEQELADRRKRQVEGGKKAAETRKKNQNGSAPKTTPVAAANQLANGIQATLNLLTVQVERIATDLGGIIDDLRDVRRQVNELPAADPDVVRKAQRFDEIQAALRGK